MPRFYHAGLGGCPLGIGGAAARAPLDSSILQDLDQVENVEGFPEDGMTNAAAAAKWIREHHVDCFFEYSEYPGVTVDEIKKSLKVRQCLSEMLDQMQ